LFRWQCQVGSAPVKRIGFCIPLVKFNIIIRADDGVVDDTRNMLAGFSSGVTAGGWTTSACFSLVKGAVLEHVSNIEFGHLYLRAGRDRGRGR